jgi:hypothetical protein
LTELEIEEDKRFSKQCALIAVDEIISHIDPNIPIDTLKIRLEYWKEVIEEIEKHSGESEDGNHSQKERCFLNLTLARRGVLCGLRVTRCICVFRLRQIGVLLQRFKTNIPAKAKKNREVINLMVDALFWRKKDSCSEVTPQ